MSYAFIDMDNLPDDDVRAIRMRNAAIIDCCLTAGEYAAKRQAIKECGMHTWHVYYRINGELDYISVIAKSEIEAAFLAGDIQNGWDEITFAHTVDVCH